MKKKNKNFRFQANFVLHQEKWEQKNEGKNNVHKMHTSRIKINKTNKLLSNIATV